MRVYLGYSVIHEAEKILGWLDDMPGEVDEGSTFENMFTTGYIRPGEFEVYGTDEEAVEGFSEELISKLLPFNLGEPLRLESEFPMMKSFFYIKSDSSWNTKESNGLIISHVLEIDKFEYQ